MDLTDNFGPKKYPNTLSYIIESLNNVKFTPQENDKIFKETANFYCKPLEQSIYKSYKFIQNKIKANNLAISDVITLPLDTDIDRSAFEGTIVKYIVKKSHRGTYNITTVDPYKIPYEYNSHRRNVSAVTGACMAFNKDVFENIGKFDENFEISFSDVEICLRAMEKGYRNIYNPLSKLYHHEMKSRGTGDFRDIDRTSYNIYYVNFYIY